MARFLPAQLSTPAFMSSHTFPHAFSWPYWKSTICTWWPQGWEGVQCGGFICLAACLAGGPRTPSPTGQVVTVPSLSPCSLMIFYLQFTSWFYYLSAKIQTVDIVTEYFDILNLWIRKCFSWWSLKHSSSPNFSLAPVWYQNMIWISPTVLKWLCPLVRQF